MRVIFHLGAHRSATTSLQHYLRLQSPLLARRGIGFWGPQRLRNEGLFAGLYAGPSGRVSEAAVRAARPRIARALAMARARGMHTLVISEENAIGSVRGNIRAGALYPEVQSRLQGFARALGSPVRVFSRLPRSSCTRMKILPNAPSNGWALFWARRGALTLLKRL